MEKPDFKHEARHEFKKLFGFEAPLCNASLACGKFYIDIVKLDKMIPNYDGDKCTYKDKKNYSLKDAIEEEYGTKGIELMQKLI